MSQRSRIATGGFWLLTAVAVFGLSSSLFGQQAVEKQSGPVKVQVPQRPLRVLLFSSGPSREYQFLRTLLIREALENRAELCVHLQTNREIDQGADIEADRVLAEFPDRIGKNAPNKKYMSL